ncbi:hypothetical protein M885DRAFT_504477 [Pelagophyceae sp. CCMP2097]|nr:hypothetical protein M885DRAFT_504477 [Pelagophyceae sp. CCMP2097]
MASSPVGVQEYFDAGTLDGRRSKPAAAYKVEPKSLYGQAVTQEHNFIPYGQIPTVRGNVATQPKSPGKVLPGFVTPDFQMPDAELRRRRIANADAHGRLHETGTRTLKQSDLDAGLLPLTHLAPAQKDHVVKSTDFFTPSKIDRLNRAKRPSTAAMAHSAQAVRFSLLPVAQGSSMRLASHAVAGVALPKRNPDQCHRGISRNVMGGFYTS